MDTENQSFSWALTTQLAKQLTVLKTIAIGLIIAVIIGFLSNCFLAYKFVEYLGDYDLAYQVYTQTGEGTNIIGDNNSVEHEEELTNVAKTGAGNKN